MTPCSPLIGRSWMWDHRAVLAALPVGDLVLTGSHDAGAYRDYQVQYSTVQGAVAQNQFFSGTSCFFCLVDARIAQILVLDPLRYLPFMRPTFDGEIAV